MILSAQKSALDVPLEYKVTFDQEIVLYKDTDILQSFCINAVDNHYVAVATMKGIREIDLRQVHIPDNDNEEDGGDESNMYTSASTVRQNIEDPKSRRISISTKSTASLPMFKSKQNILKMAFSQFVRFSS